MGISVPCYEYLDIIAFKPVQKLLGINLMGLSVHCANSIDIVALHTSNLIDRY